MMTFKKLAAVALAFGCAATQADAAKPAPKLFTLSSSAFADNAVLPLKFAGGTLCGKDSRGGNISPPLAWTNPPSGTRSFALMMIDPDGRRGLGSVHWLAYNIPASRTALQEGEGGAPSPADVTPGKNSRGTPPVTPAPADRRPTHSIIT